MLTSVTRFGIILSLWQSFKNLSQTFKKLWQPFEGLFCVWQNFKPTFAIFIKFGQTRAIVSSQERKNYLDIWSH